MIEFSLFDTIGVSSSIIIFFLGALLISIRQNKETGWREFNRMRIALACAYITLATLGVVDHIVEPNGGGTVVFTDLRLTMIIVISAFQAILFTITNLTFVRSVYVTKKNVIANILAILVVVIPLLASMNSSWFEPMRYIAATFYAAQLIYFTVLFRRELKLLAQKLSYYYDDDMAERLNWIRNCYFGALGIGIFALGCAVLPLNVTVYNSFVVVYTLFYGYIFNRVYQYNRRGAYIVAMPIDTDHSEYSTLESETNIADSHNEERYAEFEAKIEVWVKNKSYTKRDVAMDAIAKELGENRRFISSYFTTTRQTTFRKWRMELRLVEAVRILSQEKDVKISSLHERVGFNDNGNFYREFCRKYGVTPSGYRSEIGCDESHN